jgi:hypothetical protein
MRTPSRYRLFTLRDKESDRAQVLLPRLNNTLRALQLASRPNNIKKGEIP